MDCSSVDYLWIIVLLSAVWTLILTAPIHCRGLIGKQVMHGYICPNLFPLSQPTPKKKKKKNILRSPNNFLVNSS